MEIIEVLQNAEFNLNQPHSFGFDIARAQLKNAIILLEKGYSPFDDFNEIVKDFENIEDVPEKF